MLVDKVFPEFKSGYYNVVPLHCRIIQQHVLFAIFSTSPLNYYFSLTIKSTYQDAFKNVRLSFGNAEVFTVNSKPTPNKVQSTNYS